MRSPRRETPDAHEVRRRPGPHSTCTSCSVPRGYRLSRRCRSRCCPARVLPNRQEGAPGLPSRARGRAPSLARWLCRKPGRSSAPHPTTELEEQQPCPLELNCRSNDWPPRGMLCCSTETISRRKARRWRSPGTQPTSASRRFDEWRSSIPPTAIQPTHSCRGIWQGVYIYPGTRREHI